jgi:2-polyprenyl-3-methyl-5-hydroxy-6-metoxy-1,4-benzoquinol methylase
MILFKTLKQLTERVLRRIGLEPLIYHYVCRKNLRRFANNDMIFLAANPGLTLPPPQLRFDVIACSSAEYYVTTGKKMAEQIQSVIRKWGSPDTRVVCEWGCGPGRILFALESLDAGKTMEFSGSDMFAPSIQWAQSVPDCRIAFHLNNMEPPLSQPDSSVDFVYAVSVFTHLSDTLSRAWFREIIRILKPGGVFWFSTHSGQQHRNELSPAQLEKLNQGQFVAIHSWHNGSQMYTGIHCPALMKEIVTASGAELLEYQPGGNNIFQDAWIVRKRP